MMGGGVGGMGVDVVCYLFIFWQIFLLDFALFILIAS